MSDRMKGRYDHSKYVVPLTITAAAAAMLAWGCTQQPPKFVLPTPTPLTTDFVILMKAPPVHVILPTATATPTPIPVVLPTNTPTPDAVLTEMAYSTLYGDVTIVTPDWSMPITRTESVVP